MKLLVGGTLVLLVALSTVPSATADFSDPWTATGTARLANTDKIYNVYLSWSGGRLYGDGTITVVIKDPALQNAEIVHDSIRASDRGTEDVSGCQKTVSPYTVTSKVAGQFSLRGTQLWNYCNLVLTHQYTGTYLGGLYSLTINSQAAILVPGP